MSTPSSPPAVRVGQIYEPCDPNGGFMIRIVAYTPGSNRADVVDAVSGRRPRSILVRSLHPSGTTKYGSPRRTGYRMLSDRSAGEIRG